MVIEQSSQARLAMDIPFVPHGQGDDRSVPQRLVRALMVVVAKILADQVVEMAFPKDQKVIHPPLSQKESGTTIIVASKAI